VRLYVVVKITICGRGMSFLINRGLAWVNKATSDPEAEALLRRQQAELKDAITARRNFLTSERNLIATAKLKQQIEVPDAELLIKFLDDAIIFLDGSSNSTKAAIDDYFGDTMGSAKYAALAMTSFASGSYPRAEGSRRDVGRLIKIAKQAKNDNPEMPPDLKLVFDELQARATKFLPGNLYSSPDVYRGFDGEIQRDYLTPGKNDKFHVLWSAAKTKIQKNGELDFQDYEGTPLAGLGARQDKNAQMAMQKDKAQDQFSISRLLWNALNYTITILFILLILFVLGMGASMAVNLNIYKPVPYRIFYAIYGTIFGLAVVPYVLLYRWWWKGLRPKYYGFIPIIPRFFVTPAVQFLLGWLTYRPNDDIWELQEWRKAAEIIHAAHVAEHGPSQHVGTEV
jgi:hypothetical protein